MSNILISICRAVGTVGGGRKVVSSVNSLVLFVHLVLLVRLVCWLVSSVGSVVLLVL